MRSPWGGTVGNGLEMSEQAQPHPCRRQGAPASLWAPESPGRRHERTMLVRNRTKHSWLLGLPHSGPSSTVFKCCLASPCNQGPLLRAVQSWKLFNHPFAFAALFSLPGISFLKSANSGRQSIAEYYHLYTVKRWVTNTVFCEVFHRISKLSLTW